MAIKHGVYVSQLATSVATPVTAAAGIPFVVGTAPVQSVESPAAANTPVLVTSWDEAVEQFGYSDNWTKYTLCEFMYSHFKLFAAQPVIFCNVLVPSAMKSATATTETLTVSDHKGKVTIDAIRDTDFVVKQTSEGEALVKDTDYALVTDGEYCVIELLSGGSAYSASSLYVSYKKVDLTSVTSSVIVTGLDAVDLCLTTIGTVPDLICAPGWSDQSTVAAAMAAKAGSVSGLFTAHALIDVSTDATSGADVYSEVYSIKTNNNFTDEREIVCWPLVKLGDYVFHLSTQLAGLMAQVDTDNGGVPYETPSNKNLQCDSMVVKAGTEVNLTLAQANTLNGQGIVTALNLFSGWVAWGSYTGCYPSNTDVKDYFIPIGRMFDYVGGTLVKTFWTKVDDPMNRRLIDTVLDSCNIWLNGLVGQGYLLGARAEMLESENPLTSLMSGIIKLHIYITPPSPAQEIDFVLEYDTDYVTSALS